MPPGTVDATAGRVVDQRRMLELLLAANGGKRADSRRTWAAIAAALIRRADWRTGAITAPHEAIAADAGAACGRAPFSHDTIGRFIAAATAAGVLVCPEGLGGMSRVAFGGGGRNQCPTYFVVDPDAAAADLRTPPSHVSETVQVVATTAPLKGPIRPKFARIDPRAVPMTSGDRRAAAQWLCARLLVGVVPARLMAAMLAQHFAAGRSPAELLRWVCYRPDGTVRLPLPVGADRAAALARSPHIDEARMLLGIIGYRLGEWRGVPPRQRLRPDHPPAERAYEPRPPATTATRSESAEAAVAALRNQLRSRGRRC